MVVRVIDPLVLHVLVLYLIDCKIDNLYYEISLQWETSIVGNWLVVVELDEELVIFKALDYSLNHRKVIGTTNVIFEPVHHHILNEVQLKHPKLKEELRLFGMMYIFILHDAKDHKGIQVSIIHCSFSV